jgi:8-oxo-dGTP pyrophosphatase MutT (NUDIX family)
MKRGSPVAERFEQSTAEAPSDFRLPTISATLESLADHFGRKAGVARAPIRNPHREPHVSARETRDARPAAVLIAVVRREPEPTLLLTRRHEHISYGGHICFAGGGRDPGDDSLEATALRESFEEIALAPERVEIIGRLGDYVTHSGFRIAPIVGIVTPPLALRASPSEVDEILEIPLSFTLRADSYQLRLHSHAGEERGHFYLAYQDWIVSGPTVSLMMGLYQELVKTHSPTG